MITRKRIKGQEKILAFRWQQLLGKELITEEGEKLKAIYPGRINNDSGPDFRDVTITINGEFVRGDMEIHVKSSNWYRHAHDGNPEYNGVILHLVEWHDCNSTLLQNGKLIPVVCLSPELWHRTSLPFYHLPCFQMFKRRDKQALKELLNVAGKERFEQKASSFQSACWREEAGRVLFRGMMRALGYSKNMNPFEELSGKLSLNFIERLEPRESLSLKQAWLLGTAGLLPSQRLWENSSREREIEVLEQIWQSIGKGVKPMSQNDWQFSHVYPNNSPVRRLVALSYLLQRYHKRGLLKGILQLVEKTPLTAGRRGLDDSLIVAGDSYWQEHFDIGWKTRKSALLGHGKAGELMVNVILPFISSWGGITNDPELREKAVNFYLHYSKLAENEITRHMVDQLCLADTSGFTACHQQGLIHIYRTYCREGTCLQCPLVN